MSEELKNSMPDNEDAFERDAAEGFAMLGSDEEATALKAETDAAFAQQMKPTAKQKQNWVWAAAAVLILSIGVGVFTVLQPEPNKAVSLVESTPTDSNAPITADLKVATQVPAAPAEPSQTSSSEPTTPQQSKSTFAKKQVADQAASGAELSDAESQVYASSASSLAATNMASSEVVTGPIVSSANSAAPSSVPSMAAPVHVMEEQDVSEYKVADNVSQKEAEKKQTKTLSKSEKMKLAVAPSSEVTTRFLTDSAASLVYYSAGVKQLEIDTKTILKNFKLRYPLTISLKLQKDGKVSSAVITSTKQQDSEQIRLAQEELKKLQAFYVETGMKKEKELEYRYLMK